MEQGKTNLHEVIADIALLAGHVGYYSGDSRADIERIIMWAEEFETIHNNTDWDITDYMETVEKFADQKLKQTDFPILSGPIMFYEELINEAPDFTDVTTRPILCEEGHCQECEPHEANLHSVYLILLDGRKMCVADTKDPRIAEQLKNLLLNCRNRKLG